MAKLYSKNADCQSVKADILGKELEVLTRVAGIPESILDGNHHPCPKCGGKDRFRYDTAKKFVFCNQCFNKGNGDVISAVQRMTGDNFNDTLNHIANCLAMDGRTDWGGSKQFARLVNSAPTKSKDDNIPFLTGLINGTPQKSVTYDYPAADGKPAYRVTRFDKAGGGKSFNQQRYEDGNFVTGLGTDSVGVKRSFIPYPYRLQRLLGDNVKSIIIAEGEKCADALQSLLDKGMPNSGIVATTLAGGSNSAKHWATVRNECHFNGVAIRILADNDKQGIKATNTAYEVLKDVTDDIGCVIFDKYPNGNDTRNGYDVADWIDDSRGNGFLPDEAIATLVIDYIENHKTDKLKLPEVETQGEIPDQEDDEDTPKIRIEWGSEKPKEPTEWLLKDFIPLQTYTVIAGKGGVGKTFFTCEIANLVTNGGEFRGEQVPAGSVLMISREKSNILARLEGCGANLDKVGFPSVTEKVKNKKSGKLVKDDDGNILERDVTITVELVDEIRSILEEAKNCGKECRAIIIDPIGSHWGKGVDPYKEADIKNALGPLEAIAMKFKASLILIAHPNKSKSNDSSTIINGSGALVTSARSAWLLTNNKEIGERTVSCIKSNLTPQHDGITFKIEQIDDDSGRIVITNEYVDTDADKELAKDAARLAPQRTKGNSPTKEKKIRPADRAMELLSRLLKDGSMPIGKNDEPPSTILFEGNREGISEKAIREAGKRLGIIIIEKRNVAGKFLGIEWELPRDVDGNYITGEPLNELIDDCRDANPPELFPDDGEPVDGESPF